jgi:hypothetical protein
MALPRKYGVRERGSRAGTIPVRKWKACVSENTIAAALDLRSFPDLMNISL